MKPSYKYTNDAGYRVTKKINGKQIIICPFYKRWMSIYVAQCKNGAGKLEYAGGYRTEREAHSAYLLYKAKVVRSVASRQTDPRVFIALSERAAIMEMEPKPDKI